MFRYLCLIVLCLFASCQLQAGIARWDALPAVDVMHLQGPYAGREVCPMCQHGFDAGVLVFLPASTSPARAGEVAHALRTAASAIGDDRFRPFLIITGDPPSKTLLSAVEGTQRNWYVAHLATEALPGASRDFKRPLASHAYGYVFAQRRLLWAFDPNRSPSSWSGRVGAYARYAMTFLHSNYPQPVSSTDPDAPKGRLWSAPDHLSSEVVLTSRPQQAVSKACLTGNAPSRSNALVALSAPASPRIWWAKTTEDGCLFLKGVKSFPMIRAEIFAPLHAPALARIDTGKAGSRLEIRLASHTGSDASGTQVDGTERVVGLPCEEGECEAAFEGLPATLAATSRIATESEPGEPLELTGTVRDQAGVPRSNIIVYAYHTDVRGHYPANPRLSGAAARHGRLRGWARTDANGRYTFRTIRPGAYPDSRVPQHIHMSIIEPGRCTYYLNDVLFADDPRLTASLRARESRARGGNGIVQPEKPGQKGWRANRNITLGLNVPGYDGCSRSLAV